RAVIQANPFLDTDFLAPIALSGRISHVCTLQVRRHFVGRTSPIQDGSFNSVIVMLFGGSRYVITTLLGFCPIKLGFHIVHQYEWSIWGRYLITWLRHAVEIACHAHNTTYILTFIVNPEEL